MRGREGGGGVEVIERETEKERERERETSISWSGCSSINHNTLQDCSPPEGNARSSPSHHSHVPVLFPRERYV